MMLLMFCVLDVKERNSSILYTFKIDFFNIVVVPTPRVQKTLRSSPTLTALSGIKQEDGPV